MTSLVDDDNALGGCWSRTNSDQTIKNKQQKEDNKVRQIHIVQVRNRPIVEVQLINHLIQYLDINREKEKLECYTARSRLIAFKYAV